MYNVSSVHLLFVRDAGRSLVFDIMPTADPFVWTESNTKPDVTEELRGNMHYTTWLPTSFWPIKCMKHFCWMEMLCKSYNGCFKGVLTCRDNFRLFVSCYQKIHFLIIIFFFFKLNAWFVQFWVLNYIK